MSCKKIRIYYYGDGVNTKSSAKTRQGVEKKATLNLPKKVVAYGEENGFDEIYVTFHKDHLILKGGGEVLMDTDFNGGSNEYIEEITKYEWLDEDGDVVESCSQSHSSNHSNNSNAELLSTLLDDLTSTDDESSYKNQSTNAKPKVERIALSELMSQPFKKTALGILLWYPEYRFFSWVFYGICFIILMEIIY